MKKANRTNKRWFMVTGYQTFEGKDLERITWYAPTLEAAKSLLVNRPGYTLTSCNIWQLVETQERQ